MSHAIGIDLGTTNTVVAAVVDGVAVTLEDEQRRRLLPSVVSFHPSGTVLVGDTARERRLIDPENTIFSVKPLIGRPFDSDEVKAARGRFPFQFTEGAKNSTMVLARDVAYALPEISAFVLRRAKAIAEHALGGPVDRAVITVPANFNDLQRASTKIAGKLAGLEVLRILNEPTAAALAYGQSIAKAEKIAVYDLGGGTFDITLLDLTGNVFEVLATAGDTALGGDDLDRLLAERMALEVIKRFNYDPRTNPVAIARLRFIAEEVKKLLSTQMVVDQEISGIGYTEGGTPIQFTMAISREELDRIALPLVERTISVAKQSIEIIGLHPKDFDRVILVGGSTRMPLAARLVEQLFGQSPHLKVNPDEVVALGAAIQAHALNRSKPGKRRSAHDQLAKASSPPNASANPHHVDVPRAPNVPAGMSPQPSDTPAYIQFSKAAAVITFSPPPPAPDQRGAPAPSPPVKPPAVPPRKPPLPPGAARAGGASPRAIEGSPVRAEHSDVPPAGPMPARRSAAPPANEAPDLDLGGPRAQISIEPPSASLGAIVAGGDFFPAFAGASAGQPPLSQEAFSRGSAIETSDNAPLLIDVTPMSLRIETVGGYSDVLINANSPVPCEKARTFLTASDNQTVVFIRVAQGESVRFAENTYLGELELSGLKPAPRGSVKILVTFELDADGILNVRAKDKDTDRETNATMRLLGTATDAAEMKAMETRQARHVVA
ncbi:MAG: Chaperone protein DnaK [Labilithrix sp.]|nr:Chaperone protein DnaK [Labilithrix sp.]